MKQTNWLCCFLLFQQAFQLLGKVALATGNSQQSNNLRNVEKEGNDADSKQRKLDWLAINGNKFHTKKDDHWYTWYGIDEIPEDVTTGGDFEDKLRPTDICPGPNNQYTYENCPAPPDCTKVKQIWGDAKLCINRIPLPFDTDTFYVGTMKCIPRWENCDKCMCGLINYDTGICKFYQSHRPDDDRTDVDCKDLQSITFSKKYSFTPYEPKETQGPSNYPTDYPSETPSAKPSRIPSNSPTTFPSNSPSISPSKNPSKFLSVSPSENPSNFPISNPSNSPSISSSEIPSKSPSMYHSISPSLSVSPSKNPTKNPSISPSNNPTKPPTIGPTKTHSVNPSKSPSASARPTSSHSTSPSFITDSPSKSPTSLPSKSPTLSPSVFRSSTPSLSPSYLPSESPTSSPSTAPTNHPSEIPSIDPSKSPSLGPSTGPSISHSALPSLGPSTGPSLGPSTTPSTSPSTAPSNRTLNAPSNAVSAQTVSSNISGVLVAGALSAVSGAAIASTITIFMMYQKKRKARIKNDTSLHNLPIAPVSVDDATSA